MTKLLGTLTLAGVAALALSLSTRLTPVSAQSGRSGQLHVTKDCAAYTGAAGDQCTIMSSNLAEIVVGSPITYDQAAGIPAGLLDSNIVLDAGSGTGSARRQSLSLTRAEVCFEE